MDKPSDSAPTPEGKAAPKAKGRRRRRGRGGRGRGGRGKGASPPKAPLNPEAQSQAVIVALDRLAQALIAADGQRLLRPEALTLPIPLTLGGTAEDHRASAGFLLDSLGTRLKEAALAREAYVPGEVYTFREDLKDVALSPPSPRSVFFGFGPTGIPEWVDFPNLCLERGEPETDRLFGEDPHVLALVMEGPELMSRLLPAFGQGNRGYRLLGQVVAGLLPRTFTRGPGKGGRKEGVALTFQVVETRGAKGTPRLRLNILGVEPGSIPEAAAEADPRDPAQRLHRALQKTRHDLKALGRKAEIQENQGKELDLSEAVLSLLRPLRTEIVRIYRRDGRRTRHAQERHQGAERPTAFAIKDAKSAGQERLLFDRRKETIVVLGPRGRAHLFSPKGKHVTSLTLGPGEVDRKVSRGRWILLHPTQALAFKGALLQAGNTGVDGP